MFRPITDSDWQRELKRARSTTNSIGEEIKMKLHPENPTPGEDKLTGVSQQPKREVTKQDLLDLVTEVLLVMDAIVAAPLGKPWHRPTKQAWDKLNQLKERLQ